MGPGTNDAERGTRTSVSGEHPAGLSEAKLKGLRTGVGLANTRSRLQHLFGAKHRFEFEEPHEGGLAVKIAIPFTLVPQMDPDTDDMEVVA